MACNASDIVANGRQVTSPNFGEVTFQGAIAKRRKGATHLMSPVSDVWGGWATLDCTSIEAETRSGSEVQRRGRSRTANRAKSKDARAPIQVTTDCQQCCRGTLAAMGTAVDIMGGPDSLFIYIG